MRLTVFAVMLVLLVEFATGCSRTRYRTAADRDAYGIVHEKSQSINRSIASIFSVRPDPRSRFYDPSNPDCPQLPVPRPVLRSYELPLLASDRPVARDQPPLVAIDPSTSGPSTPAVDSVSNDAGVIVRASYELQTDSDTGAFVLKSADPSTLPNSSEQPSASTTSSRPGNATSRSVVVPTQAWEVLPPNCLDRMLEFSTLRNEYLQSFPNADLANQDSGIRRLTLANLMELAIINSREYQARKEILFNTALALSRQRYRYELNPSPFGNGLSANYRHLRSGGITEDRLSVPSGIGVQKTLATGGEFLARFANSVVLTFNGPTGFAADVGSEMIFDFQQSVFQRDIRFEDLTQNERDVVYATRDYLRFRKQLFRDIANQYYNLLVSYRGIEINAQDYFTNLRGFLQSQAEYRTAEKIPRVQVDQFEQNVLRTRSNLVNNCFALEAALDQLKFRLGLPTEMTIHLDLTELESISLKDELSVARQMINRARAELLNTRSATIDATTLANVAEVLADRMGNILQIQARMDAAAKSSATAQPSEMPTQPDASDPDAIAAATKKLKELQHSLQIMGIRMQVDFLRAELDSQVKAETPPPALRVLIRAIELCSSEMQIVDLAVEGPQLANQSKARDAFIASRQKLTVQLEELYAFMDELSTQLSTKPDTSSIELFERIPAKMKQAVALAEEVKQLAQEATKDIFPAKGITVESKVQSTVDETIKLSDKLLEKGPDGWEEIVLDQNEALLTGLVQRLDLMNERGNLADAWRQIKLAGDDLRSIVNLQATQVIRTKSNENKPTDFSFDDSETRLGVALDTPLNRRLQRNNFRLALINYNVGLRNLMSAEDTIKLDIREDLRQLALDRNQYTIAVASAALAYERVISTRLRLQLAVQNVAARDFLEAQQAYTNALSAIARQHVNYISDRIELFFDLEAFDVDGCGYWAGVKSDFGPEINVDFPATNPRPYDSLPPRVRYSPTIRQMEQIPPGSAQVR